jgi:predicted nucleotidyltransferase
MRPLTGTLRRPLDAVFAAPSHLALLRTLFTRPHGASGRELARLAGLSHQAANVALPRLERLGLVRRVGRGRLSLYRLNPEHEIFARIIRPILKREREMFREILRTIERMLGPHCLNATVFGSVGRGDEGPSSDLDLLVVLRRGQGRTRLDRVVLALASLLSERWGLRLNAIVFTCEQAARRIRDDHPFFRVAMRDGIPVVGSPLQEIVHGTQRRTQAR